jgi:hypothetical protein
MAKLEDLISDILCEAGMLRQHIRTRVALELPGYFRPEKKWDLVIVADGQLIAAMELKSQAGPSFGNNFNNRTEEACCFGKRAEDGESRAPSRQAMDRDERRP